MMLGGKLKLPGYQLQQDTELKTQFKIETGGMRI
jgi:hypothetical protein